MVAEFIYVVEGGEEGTDDQHRYVLQNAVQRRVPSAFAVMAVVECRRGRRSHTVLSGDDLPRRAAADERGDAYGANLIVTPTGSDQQC